MRLITDIFQYCQAEMPHWNTISISGYHIREAGSTAVQEVAFTLSNAIAYVEAALQAGLQLERFVPRLAFFFNAHNDFLEEIAKFRAARRLWSEIIRDRFGSEDPRCMRLRFHTQTAGSALTAQQPENNIIRVTLQALAAVLGGTQSLHTNSMDEALSLPTENAVQVALRTQQIIAHESGVANTVDPIAGSYAIEALTDEIHRRAVEYIQKIDDLGGSLAAIEAGFLQAEIQEAAYQTQKAIEQRDSIVVGVNEYTQEDQPKIETLRVNPEIEHTQRQQLASIRRDRDANAVESTLDQLQIAVEGDQNLMPILIQCVESHVTLGEICKRLRQIWGEYRPEVVL
jgi:methylmalonyl-CoA mutase N-terminal domain/subunit